MPPIRVLVPSRTVGYVLRLLASMERSEPESTRVVTVIDSGCFAPTTPWIPGTPATSAIIGLADYPLVRWVPYPSGAPFVFARAINLAAALHPGHHLLVLNDDTAIVTKGWLTALQDTVLLRDEVAAGLGAPLGLLSCGIVAGGVGNVEQVANLTTRSAQHPKVWPLHRTVCFVATLVLAEAWASITGGTTPEAIGLDERFVGYGFEDDDYTTRAREHGWARAATDAVIVQHIGDGRGMHGTFGPMYGAKLGERFALNQRLYQEKYMALARFPWSPPA